MLSEFEIRYRELEHALKSLLGDAFTKIQGPHERARTSGTRPAGLPHRLMMVLDDLEAASASAGTEQQYVHIESLGELQAAVHLFIQFQKHPRWSDFRRKLVDPHEYAHTFLVMLLANKFSGVSTEVEPESTARTPDLVVDVRGMEQLALEVKAPVIMQTPYPPLSDGIAEKLVEARFKAAGMGTGGQLPPSRSGILVFGGFHPWPEDMPLLEEAARRYLALHAPPAHIMGAAFLWFRAMVTKWQVEGDATYGSARDVSWAPLFRLIPNQRYSGNIQLEVTELPMRPLPAPRADRDGLYDRSPLRLLL